MTPGKRLGLAAALFVEAGVVYLLACIGHTLRLPEGLARCTVVPWGARIIRNMNELGIK